MPDTKKTKPRQGKNRKDSHGRVLRAGESERKDGSYMFRYTDRWGTRQAAYAGSLQELREKESSIQRDLEEGIHSSKGLMTVDELVDYCIASKRNLRESSIETYRRAQKLMRSYGLSRQPISTIDIPMCKSILLKMVDNGLSCVTIINTASVYRSWFNVATEEDMIRKNPFRFKMDFLGISKNKRTWLVPPVQEALMEFIQTDSFYKRYYPMFVVLLETGIRVSELCGLTLSNINLPNRVLHITHQATHKVGEPKSVLTMVPPKTEAGMRDIPLSDDAVEALETIIKNRKTPQNELMIDGHTGFVFLSHGTNKPIYSAIVERICRRVREKYNQAHPELQIEKLTPHTFRHTCCSNLISKNMNIKAVQYLSLIHI